VWRKSRELSARSYFLAKLGRVANVSRSGARTGYVLIDIVNMSHEEAMDRLSSRLKEITDGAKSNPDVLREMEALIDEFPDEPEVWGDLAYVHSMRGDRTSAVVALDRAIALAPDEPVYIFDRARYRAGLGDYSGVLTDASLGVEICDRTKFDYYRQSLIFLSAYAHSQMGKLDVAKVELLSIQERDMGVWVGELVTWSELARECGLEVGER
jgi:regulator of sirC expression with transglutaminase-like and TPR domain